MVRKLFFLAVPLLFLGSAALAEDIVYDGDWRAGETGFIHHPNHCGWRHHHRMVSRVSYNDSGYQDGVAYDSEYAPEETTYETSYAPELGVRYDGDREWREGGRDFDRGHEFRNEPFRDRDAGVGARVEVGGHDGVGAGGRVNDAGVGAGVHVGGHGAGVGVGGDTGIDIHAK